MERSKAVLEPDLPIVDPHHHLWDRPATLVAALPQTGHGFEDIIRAVPRYLLDELLADLQSGSWDEDPKVLGPLAGRVPAGLYRDATFRDGFALLQRLGLSFDTWLLEPQLPDLVDLARAFPETTIVLDHVGTPLGIAAYAGKREARFGPW